MPHPFRDDRSFQRQARAGQRARHDTGGTRWATVDV